MGLICIICGSDTIKHDVSSNVQLINSADVCYQLNCWFQTKIAKENIRNTDTVWLLLEFKFVYICRKRLKPRSSSMRPEWCPSEQRRSRRWTRWQMTWIGNGEMHCGKREKNRKPISPDVFSHSSLSSHSPLHNHTYYPNKSASPQNTHVYWWERIGNEHSRKQVYKRMQYLQMSFSRTKPSSVNTHAHWMYKVINLVKLCVFL